MPEASIDEHYNLGFWKSEIRSDLRFELCAIGRRHAVKRADVEPDGLVATPTFDSREPKQTDNLKLGVYVPGSADTAHNLGTNRPANSVSHIESMDTLGQFSADAGDDASH